MKHATIPLSDEQHAVLAARVLEGDHASVEQYVTALVEANTRPRAQERLEELLLEGLASRTIPWTGGSMEALRRKARQRI
jgi:hypothetical protein